MISKQNLICSLQETSHTYTQVFKTYDTLSIVLFKYIL